MVYLFQLDLNFFFFLNLVGLFQFARRNKTSLQNRRVHATVIAIFAKLMIYRPDDINKDIVRDPRQNTH